MILRRDPSSMIAAAIEGWDHPISREALALYDLFDVTVQVNSDPKRGKPQPHSGRPYKVETAKESKRIGDVGDRTRAEVVAILNARGHSLPV
jgi:hypothetical protein